MRGEVPQYHVHEALAEIEDRLDARNNLQSGRYEMVGK